MGYLDNAGLAHLWGKIKTALLGKQDALTAGPGIKIEGNVISAEDFPTWVKTELPSSVNWTSVTYGNGKFVLIAGNNNKAAYSADGITWTAVTLPSSAAWNSVTYGNGKFVVVAFGTNKAAYSADGITWTAVTMQVSAYWNSVTYGNGKFVAVASNNANKAAYAAMTYVTFDGLNDELALKGDELALDGQTLSLKSGDDVLSSVELPGGVTAAEMNAAIDAAIAGAIEEAY